MEGVVPVSVECVRLKLWANGVHFGLGDLDPSRVGLGVGFGVHGQSGAGRGGADEVDDDLMAGEWAASPVHRDVGEQAVLDLVPLARTGREVADGDRDADLGGECGEFDLP